MSAEDRQMVILTPEELLDCLGRISDTRITYKWIDDKKLKFEINAVDRKVQYFYKMAQVIGGYLEVIKGIECEFEINPHTEAEEEEDETAKTAPSQHYMPNKSINRLMMIFQSLDEDYRVFRFEAGEGILKGHQYFESDPNIVEVECSSIRRAIQICAKSSKEKVYNIFEMNSNCLSARQYKDSYRRAFSRMPDIVRRGAIISLVRINPKQSRIDFEKRIGFARSLVGKVFLSLSIDGFMEKQTFYNGLPVDGFVLTVGAREMNRRDKTNKIQALTDDYDINKKMIYLFYDPYQKTPALVPGTKEVLYLNKFET